MRAFSLIVFIAAAPVAAHTISGTVHGPAGPLPSATVMVKSYTIDHRLQGELTSLTGADGRFSGDLPGGELSIDVMPPAGAGLLPLQTGFHLKRALVMDVTLKEPVRISGRVVPPGEDVEIEIHGLLFEPLYTLSGADGAFHYDVEQGRYSILAKRNGAYYGRVFVDARGGDVSNVQIPLEATPIELLPDAPPVAARITVSTAGSDGIAVVQGSAGAVSGSGTVLVANVSTQQVNLGVAGEDGGFSIAMFAPPGSWLSIKFDPSGRFLPPSANGGNPLLQAPPAALIHVPPAAGEIAALGAIDYFGGLDDRPFVGQLPIFGYADPGQWHLRGTFEGQQWQRGRTFTLSGTLIIFSKNLIGASESAVMPRASIVLERLSDADGLPMQSEHAYTSTIFTPTRLPMERLGFGPTVSRNWALHARRRVAEDRMEIDWSVEVDLPGNLPSGLYRPRVLMSASGMPPHRRHLGIFASMEGGGDRSSALPLFRIGPEVRERLYWVLALDDIVNGARGALTLEDRGRFAFLNHVVTPGDVTVLQRTNPRTGNPFRYRLEPFVPMVSSSIERLVHPASIPFRFPSGELRVRVLRPSGAIDDLGSAPFVQTRSRSHIRPGGEAISGNGGRNSNHVTDVLQLTTLDQRFVYTFAEYGVHRVEMRGRIEDIDGRQYDGGGIYEIHVARPLEVETAVLPGTPFQIGNHLAVIAVTQPPVPAELEVRLRVEPHGIDRIISGQCNRFGFCRLEPVVFDQPGEYRLDVVATHGAADGTLWKGSATWGSIIETPGSSIVIHGRRGFDFVDTVQDQWFFVRQARAGGDHVNFPFHGGDVQWMEQLDPAAAGAKITLQDTGSAFLTRFHARAGKGGALEPPALEDRILAGEIPLFSSTSTGLSPSFAPEHVDQWGYFYSSVQRPGVRVREMTSEDHSGNGYWRFRDTYQLQLGTGSEGDLPNDFKFQFGGSVWREQNFSHFGGYASLFVMVPDGDADGGRVFPPFQGNGGGPSGGPLFTLKGREIDLFFHPTALRPGTILHRGQRVSIAGYSAPPLPSKVEIVITAPSGVARTIAGQANAIGWFHDPGQDFSANESGMWKAKVTILFDGRTSAGQVTAPFPTGDVLGSREGEFFFYVVDTTAEQLDLAPMPQFLRPADGPITFTAQPPAGLSNRQLTYTTTMPGFILEEKTQTSMRIVYDAAKLAKDFPNLDLHDADGFAGADTITISMLLSGTDAAGKRRHFARQIVIQGEEIQMPEQEPRPRRRSVRK